MTAHQHDEFDFVPRALAQVDPGWYEHYWYGSLPKPGKRRLGNAIRRVSIGIAKLQQLDFQSRVFTGLTRPALAFVPRSQRRT